MSDFNAEIKASFDAIDKKVGEALAKHDTEVMDLGKASKKSSDDLKNLTSQHAELHAEMKKLGDSMTSFEQSNASTDGAGAASEGIGTQFVACDAFASFINGGTTKATHTFQNNTIMEGTGNDITRHDQLPGVVPGVNRQLTVMPTVAKGKTGSNVIYYSRELAWVNNAAETAEGGQKPESDLTFEEVVETIRTIPHFIKVSKQALADSTFLSSYIDNKMSHGVRERTEYQMINGTGVGVNLNGWLKTGLHTVTDADGTVDIYGLANKMKYEIIDAGYTPDYIYMNPMQWQKAETIRRSSTDNAFLAASGAVTYVNGGLTPVLWGLPVVLSNNVPLGKVICKSYDADMFIGRDEVKVEMFEQDGNNVQENLVTIRAEARGAEAVMIPGIIRVADVDDIT